MYFFDSLEPESMQGAQLDAFLALGWFRMHQSVFTTSHVGLEKIYRVHWLRYPLDSLKVRASHQRLRRKNREFTSQIEDLTSIRPDHAELHARYRSSINFDGALSISECLFGEKEEMRNIFDTKCISVFDSGKLIAGGYFDMGNSSAASILHFFDPGYARYSLGKFLILQTLDYLNQMGVDFYYPGYVVEGLAKMNYKLFLGREEAQYFDPERSAWRPFHDSILEVQP